MEHGGSVIRYRTAHEKVGKMIEDLRDDLLSSNLVVRWLSLLQPRFRSWEIHGAKSQNYENAMGKLYEFVAPLEDER